MKEENTDNAYWKANLKIISWLMLAWFICSFGFGILFSEYMDLIKIKGFKLGFWFAQQGSIYCFVILVFIYIHLMNKLDESFSKKEGDI